MIDIEIYKTIEKAFIDTLNKYDSDQAIGALEKYLDNLDCSAFTGIENRKKLTNILIKYKNEDIIKTLKIYIGPYLNENNNVAHAFHRAVINLKDLNNQNL